MSSETLVLFVGLESSWLFTVCRSGCSAVQCKVRAAATAPFSRQGLLVCSALLRAAPPCRARPSPSLRAARLGLLRSARTACLASVERSQLHAYGTFPFPPTGFGYRLVLLPVLSSPKSPDHGLPPTSISLLNRQRELSFRNRIDANLSFWGTYRR